MAKLKTPPSFAAGLAGQTGRANRSEFISSGRTGPCSSSWSWCRCSPCRACERRRCSRSCRRRHPARYPDRMLRSLQRRVAHWRRPRVRNRNRSFARSIRPACRGFRISPTAAGSASPSADRRFLICSIISGGLQRLAVCQGDLRRRQHRGVDRLDARRGTRKERRHAQPSIDRSSRHAVAVCLPASDLPKRLSVHDGDTFRATFRIENVDTAEIDGDCAGERILAQRAKAFTTAWLARNAGHMEIRTSKVDFHGRPVARVSARGEDLGEALIAAGLARPWTGKREPWCPTR